MEEFCDRLKGAWMLYFVIDAKYHPHGVKASNRTFLKDANMLLKCLWQNKYENTKHNIYVSWLTKYQVLQLFQKLIHCNLIFSCRGSPFHHLPLLFEWVHVHYFYMFSTFTIGSLLINKEYSKLMQFETLTILLMLAAPLRCPYWAFATARRYALCVRNINCCSFFVKPLIFVFFFIQRMPFSSSSASKVTANMAKRTAMQRNIAFMLFWLKLWKGAMFF